MRVKRCKCKDPVHPGNLPQPIHEYHGTAMCGRCKGRIEYPIGRDEYEGTDSVARFMFYATRDSKEYDFEMASIAMLQRIEKLLLALLESQTALVASIKK